jgi:hypothetical protein
MICLRERRRVRACAAALVISLTGKEYAVQRDQARIDGEPATGRWGGSVAVTVLTAGPCAQVPGGEDRPYETDSVKTTWRTK